MDRPERKKKIQLPNGQSVEASEVPFQTGAEHWNEYVLQDGSVLKLRTVTTEILRVDGQYDNDGNPVYILKSTNVLAVSAPDSLRRQP